MKTKKHPLSEVDEPPVPTAAVADREEDAVNSHTFSFIVSYWSDLKYFSPILRREIFVSG